MVISLIKKFISSIIGNIFSKRNNISLGFYGPPNAGKTSLANRICKDWLGEELGKVSKIPHETREVHVKEKVAITHKGKTLIFKIADTPGIATKIDYEDFMKFMNEKQAKQRAKEATQGVIEAIKWLDDMDAVIVVLDSTQNPLEQVNLTIIGNLAARKIPVLVVGNKIDIKKKANLKKLSSAFPDYDVVGVSAKFGKNMGEFYENLFKLVK